jgi:hypothetical protein
MTPVALFAYDPPDHPKANELAGKTAFHVLLDGAQKRSRFTGGRKLLEK